MLFCLATLSGWAEDFIQVVPFEAPIGLTENDYDEQHYFDLAMVNTHSYTALQMELYLPAGMTLQLGEEVWDYNQERFDGITKRGVFLPNHVVNVDAMPDVAGHYHITMYDEDLGVIKGNSGWMIRFYYLTSADMKPGYYPIRVSDVVFAIDGDTGVYPETCVSYAKVGTPNPNSFLDLGILAVPSFVEEKLPETNVIRKGVCQKMLLSDGSSLELPYSFKAVEASYTRSMANEWATVCLPFDVVSDEEVTDYYYVTEVNDDVLVLEKQHTVMGGVPAIARKRGDVGIVAKANDVQVTTVINNHDGMMGSYTQDLVVDDTDGYYIKSNQFWKCNGWFYCDAFRSYLSLPSAFAKALSISDSGETTRISDMADHSAITVTQIYGLNGQRQSELKRGTNIIRYSDGSTKKIIIK